MIDTVILKHELSAKEIERLANHGSSDSWSPSLQGIIRPPYIRLGKNGSIKSMLNLSDKNMGTYGPKLTLYKRIVQGGFRYILYIDFSVPKLLFNNNFEEVSEKDFHSICITLDNTLRNNGICLQHSISECEVKTIHFSKNIILQNGLLSSQVIAYLAKANMPMLQHQQETKYTNAGKILYYFTNSRSFCVYDKKQELINSRKTECNNMEKDSWCQRDWLQTLQKTEIVRLELRLNNKQIIQKELNALNPSYPTTSSFSSLFSLDLAQQLLCQHFAEIDKRIPPILQQNNTKALFESMVALNPHTHPKTIISAIGLKALSDSGMSTREIRASSNLNNRQWYALIAKFNQLHVPDSSFDILSDIRQQLTDFKMVRLDKTVHQIYNLK